MNAKAAKKRARTTAKSRRGAQRPTSRASAPEEAAAVQKFVEDSLIRGDAAKLTKEGKLPLRASFVITGQNPDGTTKMKRVRLKAF